MLHFNAFVWLALPVQHFFSILENRSSIYFRPEENICVFSTAVTVDSRRHALQQHRSKNSFFIPPSLVPPSSREVRQTPGQTQPPSGVLEAP